MEFLTIYMTKRMLLNMGWVSAEFLFFSVYYIPIYDAPLDSSLRIVCGHGMYVVVRLV